MRFLDSLLQKKSSKKKLVIRVEINQLLQEVMS